MRPLRIDVAGSAFVLVWSSGYVVGALAASAAPPLAVTLWRFAFAAAVFAALAWRAGDTWPRGAEIARVSVAGVLLFGMQFAGIYLGLAAGMPAGTTALIACSSPLLVAVISAALGWERLRARQWLGIAFGAMGVVITLADRVALPAGWVAPAWTLLGLGGLTAGTLLHSRLSDRTGSYALPAVGLAAATVVLAVWAPLHGSLAIPLTTRSIGSFAWLATVSGVGAPLLLFLLIRTRGATRASSSLFLVPAVAAIAAWPVLGTPVAPSTIVGLTFAAVGLRLLSAHHSSAPAPANASAEAARSSSSDAAEAAPVAR
jgi:drug/metabolite transporter (DMT)-like permease